jgi:hypothetical protein
MKEKTKCAGLAQENGFGLVQNVIAHFAVAGKWCQQCSSPRTCCSKECNKYDMTSAAQSFFLLSPHHNDWSKWFAICCPSFSFHV